MSKHAFPIILATAIAALVSCGQPGPSDSGDGQPSALVIPEVSVPEGHMVVLTVPDGDAAREHLAGSLLGRAYRHASMAPGARR